MGRSKKRGQSSESSEEEQVSSRHLLKRLNKLERRLAKREKLRPRRDRSDRRSRSRSTVRRVAHQPRSLDRDYQAGHRECRDHSSPRATGSHRSSVDRTSQGSARSKSPGDQTQRGLTPVNAREGYMDSSRSISPSLIIHNEEKLPEDILTLLGEDPSKVNEASFNIHEALNSRWSHIISQGLSADEREKLFGKYPIPSNCKALIPPVVNPEILPILSGLSIKKDAFYVDMQNQIGKGVSALAKGMNSLLEDRENIPPDTKGELLMSLGDSGRILSNIFYSISNTRKELITPALNKSLRDLVSKTSSGEFLFGSDLGDKIRTAKLLEKTGREMKAFQPTPTVPPKRYRTTDRQTGGKPQQAHLNKRRPVRHQARETGPQRGQPSRQRQYKRRP